ncbi:MAG: SDR family oxidoreductase [Alphaproteobacteria bacterium]|nr:SDR family oxidoreductase [Alphaproteobacteria bacterium]
MELGLRGRTALVTGASKGIGEAIAHGLAAEGVHLHLTARSADKLTALAKQLAGQHGVRVASHALDLGVPGAPAELAAKVGELDILVNNAGAIPGGDLWQVDEARWRHAWELKVFGYVNLTRAVYARMRERRKGVIVNVTGLAGSMPQAGYIAGSTGNAGLNAFGEAMGGASLLEDGIRLLSVAPGLVTTERMVTMLETKAQQTYGDKSRWRDLFQGMHLPMGRPAEAAEVADLVVFLASDRAAYISGTTITIDGGFRNRPTLF